MKIALLIILLAVPLLPQESKPQESKPQPEREQPGIIKFIELKHLSGDRLSRVRGFVQNFYMGRANLVHDETLKTFAIQANRQADIDSAEAMIRRFDVPAAEVRSRQLQLTLYLLEPSDQDPAAGQRIPAELTSTAEQLRNLFGHKHLRVVETTIMQGYEGSTYVTRGVIPSAGGQQGQIFTAKYKEIRYNDTQKMVVVNGFGYFVNMTVGSQSTNSSVESDLTIKEGQKVVIGKVSKGQNEPNGYLVVTAKVE